MSIDFIDKGLLELAMQVSKSKEEIVAGFIKELLLSGDCLLYQAKEVITSDGHSLSVHSKVSPSYLPYRLRIQLERENKILRDALDFYANKDNWTITEDYEGYVVEGFIVDDDIEKPPKIPHTWSGYGHGGKRAREALAQVRESGVDQVLTKRR